MIVHVDLLNWEACWRLPDCALGARDCLIVHWEAGTCGCALKTLEAGDR